MEKLAKALKARNIQQCYLFFGEEKYLINLYANKMKEFIGEDAGAMNIDEFSGKTARIQDIFGALETMPFFSEYRLVIVKNSGLFAAGRKDDSQICAKGLADIADTSILIFIEESVDKRGVMYKAVSKAGRAVEFKRPTETQLAQWAMRQAKELGAVISKDTSIYLIRQTQADMEQMLQEINKLAAYSGETAEISNKDIDLICKKSLETRVFTLVDALAKKNAQKAMEIFENLCEIKESPLMVLALIARQFRMMLHCREMKDRAPGEVAATIGVPEFAVKEYIRQGANFPQEVLVEAIRDCLSADVGIKSGKIAERVAVEVIIVRYATGRG